MARRSFLPLLLPALPVAAFANDSSAEIAVGGLVLTRNDAITMDEEDLTISAREIRVRYRFTNRSARDVETLVSFPVPDLPDGLGGGYLGDRALPDWRELRFRTTVDGKPARLDSVERAEIAGRDVTQRLRELGWPLRWNPMDVEQDGLPFLRGLDEADRAAFLREGLLRHSPDYDALVPAWNLVTHVTRRQFFPAGRTVEVVHSYVPLVGGSVGGALSPQFRDSEYFAGRASKYCIDRAFLAALDRRLASGPGDADPPFHMERWIGYILKSGANWRGPIGRFRLVVDKGRPENLVSFCMDGVRKISPTRFEVRRTNFEPDRDIDVLIVTWSAPEE